MRTLKLTIAYDGTAYAGWQFQPDQPTVQGTLENAIAKVTGQRVRMLASGRTDAGVHALGQVVGLPHRFGAAAGGAAAGASTPTCRTTSPCSTWPRRPTDFHPIATSSASATAT